MSEKMNLTAALKKYFGFDTFKGDQERIIQNLMDGNDTFVLMPTGGGKSLCYQLPSLLMEGTAIVISPLIALMKNQVDVITSMSETEGTAHYLNSSLNKAAIDQVKSDVMAGRTKLLYVAPESLTKEENVEFLRSVKISFYAIDEAHCISEWGHDFRPEYRKIRPIVNEIGKAPIIALTATATDKVRTDIKKNLGIVDAVEFKSSFNRPNLYYEVRPKTKEVDKDIIILGIYYIIVIMAYLIFEMIPINYRPIPIEGVMEASYPSSTTLLVLSVMPTLVEQAGRRLSDDVIRKLIAAFAVLFLLFMVIGRLISGVHWFTDIIGSVLLSIGLYYLYKGCVLSCSKEA